MSRVLALFISSFLVKKPSEMKKQKEKQKLFIIPHPHPPEKTGVKQSQGQDKSLYLGECEAGLTE